MSESTAAKRIGAARTARRFPVLFSMVAHGEIHLSGIHRLTLKQLQDLHPGDPRAGFALRVNLLRLQAFRGKLAFARACDSAPTPRDTACDPHQARPLPLAAHRRRAVAHDSSLFTLRRRASNVATVVP